MEHPKIVADGITFDDVLLIPARSDFIPAEADTRSKLTRTIELNIPLVSAPMDTVTEAALAIALAQEGGIGIIHKNLAIENQSREVEKVKRSENGVIVDPITLPPSATIATARRIMKEYNVSGIPIIEGGEASDPRTDPTTPHLRQGGNGDANQSGRLVGIMTPRELKSYDEGKRRIGDVMK